MQRKKNKGQEGKEGIFPGLKARSFCRKTSTYIAFFPPQNPSPKSKLKPADGLSHFQEEAGEEGDAEWAAAEAELIQEDSSCLLQSHC